MNDETTHKRDRFTTMTDLTSTKDVSHELEDTQMIMNNIDLNNEKDY